MFLVNFGQYIFYYESLSYNFVSTQKEYPPPPCQQWCGRPQR